MLKNIRGNVAINEVDSLPLEQTDRRREDPKTDVTLPLLSVYRIRPRRLGLQSIWQAAGLRRQLFDSYGSSQFNFPSNGFGKLI